MHGFTWDRLGASALVAGILTFVVAFGRFLDRGELALVTTGMVLLLSIGVAYLIWPAVGPSYGITFPLTPKLMALLVLAGLASVLVPRFITAVTGWNSFLASTLLVAAVIVIGSGISRMRAHRGQGS